MRRMDDVVSPVKKNSLEDIIKFALIALLIVVPIRWFVAQPFIVRGASMEPTFLNGEYLIVDQLAYRFEEPARGDVIIMRYPKDPSMFFIKRIIGLPNETVEILGSRVVVDRPNAAPLSLDESFIPKERLQSEYGVYELGPDEYFVMGDNRIESSDSRSWGALPKKDVVGRALVRLFPPAKISLFPGKVTFAQSAAQ